jgi:hypothetical protein
MAVIEQIVRQAEFAKLCNVSRACVCKWIAEGKIGPEALVGSGGRALVRAEIATAHLRERLDPTKRFGLKGLNTRLDNAPAEPWSPSPRADTVEHRIKEEKLRQAELATRRAEEQDRLASGKYVLASAMRDETARLAARMFEAFNGALTDFASAFAAEYKVPARDALHLLRKEMRRVRERVSADYAAVADEKARPWTCPGVHVHKSAPTQCGLVCLPSESNQIADIAEGPRCANFGLSTACYFLSYPKVIFPPLFEILGGIHARLRHSKVYARTIISGILGNYPLDVQQDSCRILAKHIAASSKRI